MFNFMLGYASAISLISIFCIAGKIEVGASKVSGIIILIFIWLIALVFILIGFTRHIETSFEFIDKVKKEGIVFEKYENKNIQKGV